MAPSQERGNIDAMDATNHAAPGGALRFGDLAFQCTLGLEGAASLGETQRALLDALAAVGELVAATRLSIELVRFDEDGLDADDGPVVSVAWPARAVDLRPRVTAALARHGASAPGNAGRAVGTVGPLIGRRVRVALPPGARAARLGLANERGEMLPGAVRPAAALSSGASVWVESPSTDLCSSFLLRISGPGRGRLELTLGNLLLDAHRDGRPDDEVLLGAPLSAWRTAACAHLVQVMAALSACGWRVQS